MNCSVASTWMTLTPRLRAKVFITCSPSLSRSRPLSTKTQVSWSPMARCSSAATTEESTPPDRPRMTSSLAHLLTHPGDRLGHVVRHVPVAAAAADVAHEAGDDVAALEGVRDLGVKLDAIEAARLVGHAGNRGRFVAGDDGEARRHFRDLVAMAHPDVEQAVALGVDAVLDVFEQARNGRARALRRSRTRACGRSPPCRRAARPWSACRSRCPAPARRAGRRCRARAASLPRRPNSARRKG